MAFTSRWLLTAALVGVTPLALSADTLYLRNGRRIEGDLISVRGTTIEFQDRSGNARTIRVDRREVSRIELDDQSDYGGGSGGRWGIPGEYDRAPGARERQVSVAANVPWTDTGIELSPGQTITVQASGEVRWGRDRRDGPQGEKNSPFNKARPLPNRPSAALIAGSMSRAESSFVSANPPVPR